MVKRILQLFLVCSLLLQAQSVKIDQIDAHNVIPANQRKLHSKNLISHNSPSSLIPSPITTVTSLSYTIKPLSIIPSSLPSGLYTTHTFISNSKKKRGFSYTSITAESILVPKSDFSETVKYFPTKSTSLPETNTIVSDKISSITVINNISTPDFYSDIRVVSLSHTNTKATESSSILIVKDSFTSKSIPTSNGVLDMNSSTLSIPVSSDDTQYFIIPTIQPSIDDEILKKMLTGGPTLQKPSLSLHSSHAISSNNNNILVSTIPTPTSSNITPIRAAQVNNQQQSLLSFSSIIPSISKTPQQIELKHSSLLYGEASSVTNISAQKVTDPPDTTKTLTSNNTQTTVKVIAKEIKDPEAHIRPCYRRGRKVEFSQYWIPKENEWDETNEGRRVFLGGNEKMKLYDRTNKEIGMVPVDMYHKCRMEGTCLLENGDLINIEGNYTDAFIKIGGTGRKQNVFGLGSGSQNLVPFISVAANDIPYGQKLYISALDGVDLGYGMKHNGCVRVDDDSWSFDSCQIDFFVVTYVDYLYLDLDSEVSIKYADCKLMNYVTPYHLAFVKASTDRTIIPQLLDAKSTFS